MFKQKLIKTFKEIESVYGTDAIQKITREALATYLDCPVEVNVMSLKELEEEVEILKKCISNLDINMSDVSAGL